MDDKQDFDLILAVITNPAGYAVDLFGGWLSCYRLEDGRYSVNGNEGEDPKRVWERLYKDPRRAVRSFLKTRNELKLGFDYEKIGLKNDK